MHVGLKRQIREAEAILAMKDVPIDCFPSCTQELPKENFLEVVLLATLDVRKCHGYKGQIIIKNDSPPKIWFFTCRLFKYGDQIHKQCGKDVTEIFIFT